MVKKALGKGLEALIPKNVTSGAMLARTASPLQVPVARIRPNPFQPRRHFSAEDLQDLVASVKERGIMQPVLVRKKGEGWELIAGERRLRAAQKLGLLTVPAVEVTATDADSLEIALVENLQRSDLNPLEEAEGYRRLQDEFSLTQDQIAKKVGKERATVANAMRLLKLSSPVQEMLVSGRLSAGHARVLAALPTPEAQKKLADRIVGQNLTVRDAENILAGVKGPTKSRKTAKPRDPNVAKLEEQLRRFFETKVTVRSSGRNKGAVVVEYYSLEELERVLDRLRRGGFRA